MNCRLFFVLLVVIYLCGPKYSITGRIETKFEYMIPVLNISGVSSKEVTGMVLLQAYFRNSDVLNGFYGIPRSGANYI